MLELMPPYSDLGLVVDGANIAAGASVYSNWFDGVAWVRNVLIFSQSDQIYDVNIMRRDSTNTPDWGVNVAASNAATASQWRNLPLVNQLLGYSVKFYFKNVSASVATFGRLKVQLMS